MPKIKVSDYIANYLVSKDLEHVFMLTGGGAMHLNDSFGKHEKLTKIFNHHEQASAMAAESYARITGKVPIVNVTTGPGGINTLNGVFGAWVDSLPMLIVSGQVKYETTVGSTKLPLRQLGDQECEIVKMVAGITKYSAMVTDPLAIKLHLDKALELTQNGRPGPVWLDIPMNVQGAIINTEDLYSLEPGEEDKAELAKEISLVLELLSKAQKPLIFVGAGIHISGAKDLFLELLDLLKIPAVCGWNAYDLLYNAHASYVGRPGSLGDRSGNFAVQNADLILILGSRLNIRQISYNWQSFAKNAKKIMVDIDAAELQKPTLNIDFPIQADLKTFLPKLIEQIKLTSFKIDANKWLSWCKERVKRYPVVLPEYWNLETLVNPYCFMYKLSECLPEEQIIVTGDGTACVVSFQAMIIKKGQRLYTNSGCASMGYDLPAAIGAFVGSGGKEIICLAGDGSIMQNIQELATIAFNNYNIKIFILNNQGYHSIRQTQQAFYQGPLVGVGPDSGLGFPSFEALARAFELPYYACKNHASLDLVLSQVLNYQGPLICEVFLDLKQAFAPKLSSKKLEDGTMVTSSLEDMAPFLSREELLENYYA